MRERGRVAVVRVAGAGVGERAGHRDGSHGPPGLWRSVPDVWGALGVPGLVLVAFRWSVLLAAGAVLLAGTAVGLLLSAGIGLFGYQESLAVPYAATSLTVEFAGTAVLAAAVVIVLAARLRPPLVHSGAWRA